MNRVCGLRRVINASGARIYRLALSGHTFVQVGSDGGLFERPLRQPVLTLAPPLEQVLQDSLRNGGAVIEPGLAERMHRSIADSARRQEASGQPAVLLVPPGLRPLLAR